MAVTNKDLIALESPYHQIGHYRLRERNYSSLIQSSAKDCTTLENSSHHVFDSD